jgi:hypothetical protein
MRILRRQSYKSVTDCINICIILGRRVANRIGDPHHQRLALDVSFPVAGREVGEIMRQVGKIGIEICKKLIDGGINMMKVLNQRCT